MLQGLHFGKRHVRLDSAAGSARSVLVDEEAPGERRVTWLPGKGASEFARLGVSDSRSALISSLGFDRLLSVSIGFDYGDTSGGDELSWMAQPGALTRVADARWLPGPAKAAHVAVTGGDGGVEIWSVAVVQNEGRGR